MATDADESERDAAVIAATTPGPWTVHSVDDSYCMSSVTIAQPGGTGELDDHENNIAIVLLQQPRYADVGDRRWDQNAQFIVRARTRWPNAIEFIAALKKKIESLSQENRELRAMLGKRNEK